MMYESSQCVDILLLLPSDSAKPSNGGTIKLCGLKR